MITRAQAEALLTLAESLEACERLGVELHAEYSQCCLVYEGGGFWVGKGLVSAMAFRLAVNSLIPKQEQNS